MRIVKPSVLLLEQPISPEDVMRRIELCGRVCYKSEGKITSNSYKGFIQRIIKRGHEAVLEHGNLIIGMSKDSDGGSGVWFSALDRAFEQTGTASYIRKTHGNAQNIVSGNVRAWRGVMCYACALRRTPAYPPRFTASWKHTAYCFRICLAMCSQPVTRRHGYCIPTS